MDRTGYVTVMLSHDYCHFEVSLPLPPCEQSDAEYLKIVDDIRKDAMRLADKAVAQYKTAKENANRLAQDQSMLENLRWQVEHILKKPEAERTPEEKARVKTIEDRVHHSRRRPVYDYEDDWAEPDFADEQDDRF